MANWESDAPQECNQPSRSSMVDKNVDKNKDISYTYGKMHEFAEHRIFWLNTILIKVIIYSIS